MAAKKASADLDPELDEGTVLETSPPPDTDPFPDQEGSTPDWFKTAVFYEVMVRSFRDSNGDGTGDFKGLIEKLDYLEWLGVDCLWIPPFFSQSAARRRLRRLRLRQHPPGDRHRRRLPRVPRRGAQARPPRDHRLRHEPHE